MIENKPTKNLFVNRKTVRKRIHRVRKRIILLNRKAFCLETLNMRKNIDNVRA
jgi:hypothetical protein